jgi:outer membrane immunogenic protein
MLKKLLIASAILAASSTFAFAAGAPYVGAGLGVNNSKFKLTEDNGNTLDGLGSRGGALNVFGGYGATVNQNIYLGGELFANASNTDVKGSANVVGTGASANLDLRTKYSYGVSFMPGWMATDHTMVFGRIGVVKTRFEYKETATGFPSQTSRKNITGGQLGLGMQTDLTQNLAVRGEYVYTSYRSTTMLGNKIKPSTDQFNLGLVYKFD